jgi:hypothetical protein
VQKSEVTVSPVNDPPTLDTISDVVIDEDTGQQTVNLSGITAGGGESQPLRVIASSNKSGLILGPSITYTSANTTGILLYTPVAEQSGVSLITVIVEVGGLDEDLSTQGDNATFSQTFELMVSPVNDAPTLAGLSKLSLDKNAPAQTIDLAGISAGEQESQP